VSENSMSENYVRFLGALYLLTEGELESYVEIDQVCERADIPATEDEDGGYSISTHLSKQGQLRSLVSLTPEGKALVERYLSE
jgi:hypothetical protein